MSNLNPFRRQIRLATTGITSKKLGTVVYDRDWNGTPTRTFKGKLLTR